MGQIVPDQAKSGWVPAGKSYGSGRRRRLMFRLSVGTVIADRLIDTICRAKYDISRSIPSFTNFHHVIFVSRSGFDGLRGQEQ